MYRACRKCGSAFTQEDGRYRTLCPACLKKSQLSAGRKANATRSAQHAGRGATCAECGGQYVTTGRAIYCSERCRFKAWRGEDRRTGQNASPEARRKRLEYARKYQRLHPKLKKPLPEWGLCGLCGASFSPMARGQAYCCTGHKKAAIQKRTWARKSARMASDPLYAERVRAQVANALHRMRVRRTAPKGGEARARARGNRCEQIDIMAVFNRDGWVCQVCGKPTPRNKRGTMAHNAPELDHRVPIARGGGHTYDNVQCCCYACNRKKHAHRAVGQLPIFSMPTELLGT